MNQRVLAAFLAVPLVAALAVVALLAPLPYTTYSPGPTIDVLGRAGRQGDHPGPRAEDLPRRRPAPDDHGLGHAQGHRLNLFQVMGSWLDRNDAVYPKEAVYPDDKTADQVRDEGQVQMVSSQDTAVAVALARARPPVTPALEVLLIDARVARRRRAGGARHLPQGQRHAARRATSTTASEELRAAIRATPAGRADHASPCCATARRSTSRSRPRRRAPTSSAVTITGAPQSASARPGVHPPVPGLGDASTRGSAARAPG